MEHECQVDFISNQNSNYKNNNGRAVLQHLCNAIKIKKENKNVRE